MLGKHEEISRLDVQLTRYSFEEVERWQTLSALDPTQVAFALQARVPSEAFLRQPELGSQARDPATDETSKWRAALSHLDTLGASPSRHVA